MDKNRYVDRMVDESPAEDVDYYLRDATTPEARRYERTEDHWPGYAVKPQSSRSAGPSRRRGPPGSTGSSWAPRSPSGYSLPSAYWTPAEYSAGMPILPTPALVTKAPVTPRRMASEIKDIGFPFSCC